MSFSRWFTADEMKERLDLVNIKDKKITSGIPLLYEKDNIYVNKGVMNNLVIGSMGSGKTQAIILPSLKLSMLNGDSIIVNDPLGEIYKVTANKMKEENYQVVVLNFNDARFGNNWNPLLFPYKLYKEGNKDKAIDYIDDLGYYLFEDCNRKDTDPFWINSVINYFSGLCQYLFENAKEEEINLISVNELSNYVSKNTSKFMVEIEKYPKISVRMLSILEAPPETKASILSVYRQKIALYLSRDNIENMLSNTDFDLLNILSKKTIVYIIGGMKYISNNLIPLFIDQVINIIYLYDYRDRHLNILLDDFDTLLPIRDFYRKLTISRSLNISITVAVQSFIHLQNMYSKEEVEILKMCFSCIMYLLTEDIYTLEEISKYCGKKDLNNPLISVEELKTINTFEAVILLTRTMPFKTTLIPDYKYDWGFENTEEELYTREVKDISVYKKES